MVSSYSLLKWYLSRSFSMKEVVKVPAWKAWWRISIRKKGRVVLVPLIQILSSACFMLIIASWRSLPVTISLAIMESYDATMDDPARTPVSILTPGPSGRLSFSIFPGAGAKPACTSSAFIRHSMAHPASFTSFCLRVSSSPEAIRICCSMRSMPVIISVTGCSTWMRVFISMK